jgi:predicted Zn-dependent protease
LDEDLLESNFGAVTIFNTQSKLFFFDKLEAFRYQGQRRHPNYIGIPLRSHPLTIARIIKKEK